MRTEKVDGGPETSASGGLFGYRKRMDGGYTVATLGVRTIDLVPDNFRLMMDYMPGGEAALAEAALPVRLALYGGMAHQAALEPRRGDAVRGGAHARPAAGDPFVLERSRNAFAAAFPASFRDVKIAESWGGMIDVMPDAIPVISAVDQVPGFFIATGFSGHGFGIGPGAGRLVADMIAGGPTIVDPTPFRLSRFTDGSNLVRPHPLAS